MIKTLLPALSICVCCHTGKRLKVKCKNKSSLEAQNLFSVSFNIHEKEYSIQEIESDDGINNKCSVH